MSSGRMTSAPWRWLPLLINSVVMYHLITTCNGAEFIECDKGMFGPECEYDAKCLAVHPNSRENCGWERIKRWQCLKQENGKCCFDNSIRKKIFCYKALNPFEVMGKIMLTNDGGCDKALEMDAADETTRIELKDCGWPGISEAQCRAFNCCWQNIWNTIWCFRPLYQ